MTSLLKLASFPIGNLACNCSVIYSSQTREAIAIDPGNDADAFLKKIKTLDVQVKYLLHTHAHFDHIGHSDIVRTKIGAPLHLHKDDLFLYRALREQGLFFGQQVGEPGEVDHYIEDEEEYKIQVQNLEIKDQGLQTILKTIHTPGHTPGSCSFYTELLEDGPMLFTGDTLFSGTIGRTDLPGGDFHQLIHSIQTRILKLPEETTCIPGHGAQTTLSNEKRYNPFLKK